MKYIIFILSMLLFVSCKQDKKIKEIREVDAKVNEQILKRFNSQSPDLWNELEDEFYLRLRELEIFKFGSFRMSDLRELIYIIESSGYPDEFFVDFNDQGIKELVDNLDQIGFKKGNVSAQRFLHELIKPVIEDNPGLDELDDPSVKLFLAYGNENPDSVQINFSMAISDMNEFLSNKNLRRPGVQKCIIIFFFSRMMDKEFGRY